MPSKTNKSITVHHSKTTTTKSTSSKTTKQKNDISNVSFKDINGDYILGNYGGFKVIIMKKNDYINATKICNDAVTKNGTKKEFRYWKQNSNTDDVIEEISKTTGISTNDLMITVTGGKLLDVRGTYVHPMLITLMAHWISPKFAVKVSIWIEQWKKYSDENTVNYFDALSNLESYDHSNKEKLVQKKLQKKYGGEIEVPTKIGNIDLLTDDSIIEIKTYDNWKHAVGQIIMYSKFYPNKDKYICLFDANDKDVKMIKKLCSEDNINVLVYD